MAKEFKEIVEPSVVVFGFLLQDAILDGYRIQEQQPVNFFGGQYIVGLEKGQDDVVEDKEKKAEVDTGHGDPPRKAGRPAKEK